MPNAHELGPHCGQVLPRGVYLTVEAIAQGEAVLGLLCGGRGWLFIRHGHYSSFEFDEKLYAVWSC